MKDSLFSCTGRISAKAVRRLGRRLVPVTTFSASAEPAVVRALRGQTIGARRIG